MNQTLARQLYVHRRKTYTSPDQDTNLFHRGKVVTIVVGLRCTDGIVLCADRQISVPGHHKYYEQKLYPVDGRDWVVVFGYAGFPDVMKEAHGKICGKLNVPNLRPENVYDSCDEVLTTMASGRQFPDFNLSLLVAISIKGHPLELLTFGGKGLHRADGFTCLGVGESSLIRYLADALYSPLIDVRFGESLAIYTVEKAKKYVDLVGGETDLIILKQDAQWLMANGPDVWNKALVMEGVESRLLRQIIEAGDEPL
jgi:20S proteasome alpha/beta subunit